MINSETIEKAVYDLCVQANTTLPDSIFDKLLDAYNAEKNEDAKQTLGLILQNYKLLKNKTVFVEQQIQKLNLKLDQKY